MKKILAVLMILGISFFCSGNLLASPIYNPDTGHWYDVTSYSTWHDAENYAVSNGGHLVTVNDQSEMDWLVQKFVVEPHYDYNYWIGLNDEAQWGIYVWSSGEPLTYINWYPGEPNHGSYGDEHFAMFDVWSQSPDKWNDVNAFSTTYGIAEYSGPAPVPEPSSLLLIGFGGIIATFIKRRRKT